VNLALANLEDESLQAALDTLTTADSWIDSTAKSGPKELRSTFAELRDKAAQYESDFTVIQASSVQNIKDVAALNEKVAAITDTLNAFIGVATKSQAALQAKSERMLTSSETLLWGSFGRWPRHRAGTCRPAGAWHLPSNRFHHPGNAAPVGR
jgi:hypothetical protein